MVTRLSAQLPAEVSVALLDTDARSLPAAPAASLQLGRAQTRGMGTGGEAALGVASAESEEAALRRLFAGIPVAYVDLSKHLGDLLPESRVIATYALCGFANFSSIAIQIGGIGGLAPTRRADLARLGLLAVLGGTIATLMTATIAGVLSQF